MTLSDIFFVSDEYLADDVFGVCPRVFLLLGRKTQCYDRLLEILTIFFRHTRIIRSRCSLANSRHKKEPAVAGSDDLSFRYEIPFPIAGVSDQSRFECLLRILYIGFHAQEICFLRRRADDLEECKWERHLNPTVILVMPSLLSGIDFQEHAAMERVHFPQLCFLDKLLHAHPLDERLPFGLVLFLEDAFRRRFFENSFLRNLPTA